MTRALTTFSPALDAAKVLEAVVLEAVYDGPQGERLSAESWAVDFFAASALPVP